MCGHVSDLLCSNHICQQQDPAEDIPGPCSVFASEVSLPVLGPVPQLPQVEQAILLEH